MATVAHPTWDLEQYYQNYRGHGQIHRLRFIALKSQALQVDALKHAIRLIKDNTLHVSLYRETVEQLQALEPSPPEAMIDQAWIDQALRISRTTTEKLEAELKNYKNNLIKESIRMGHMDLAEHYYRCGDYENSLKCYMRIRDYCTSPKHLLDQCIDAINVGFQMRNFPTVQAYISKAQNAPEGPDKVSVNSKIKASAALHSLITNKYHAAALDFLQVGPDLASNFNEVLSPNDIAIYGGLCAMAFFDREDLKSRLLDNAEFKSFLELEPHIREAAQALFSARYTVMLEILDRHRSDFILDLFLSPHVDILYREIRQRALVQAFSPYSSLELATLSSLFATPINEITAEVSGLIETGRIKGRLNYPEQVIVAREVSQQSRVFETSCKMASNYIKISRMLLLNLKVAQAELEVRSVQELEETKNAL